MHSLSSRKRIRLPSSAYRLGHAFSITVTTKRRYPWFRLHMELPAAAVDLLACNAKDRGTLLYAWCIMPDHIHLLLRDRDLVDFVRLLKGKLALLARRLEPDRALWQRSFYDHALRREETLSDVARYIWHNPVRAGLVMRAREYPWSGSLVWPDWTTMLEGGSGESGRG